MILCRDHCHVVDLLLPQHRQQHDAAHIGGGTTARHLLLFLPLHCCRQRCLHCTRAEHVLPQHRHTRDGQNRMLTAVAFHSSVSADAHGLAVLDALHAAHASTRLRLHLA